MHFNRKISYRVNEGINSPGVLQNKKSDFELTSCRLFFTEIFLRSIANIKVIVRVPPLLSPVAELDRRPQGLQQGDVVLEILNFSKKRKRVKKWPRRNNVV